MTRTKQVTIIGGGIIGLACAYYLNQKGHQVTVIDRNSIGDSCATGNAGYVTPSHFIPLAAPGMIKKGLKWILDPESPFYIRPRASMSMIQWLWKFNQHCNAAHVNRVKRALYELCNESKRLHLELAENIGNSYQLKENGIFVITQNRATLKEELDIVSQAQDLGLNACEVSAETLHKKFPDLQLEVLGGIYFPEDAHLQPGELLTTLYQYLISRGVEFIEGVEVQSLKISKSKVTAIELLDISEQLKRIENVEELVIASGSWSPALMKQLNVRLPIQAGKGYSITIENPWKVDTPIILSDSAVAITPFEDKIRFGGTMEFAGLERSINLRRVSGILKSVKRFIPSFEPEQVDLTTAWSGLRPCSPDGLPLVGKLPNFSNLSVAAGHAMLGLTLAPVTGCIISDLISGADEKTSKSAQWLSYLNVNRFE